MASQITRKKPVSARQYLPAMLVLRWIVTRVSEFSGDYRAWFEKGSGTVAGTAQHNGA
jgi:hypothetical protein